MDRERQAYHRGGRAGRMHGTGVPLATPFDDAGAVGHDALRAIVEWTTERGVDFLVPCGSTGEAELLTLEERAAVVETVVEAAPADTPVLAGTGHPGLAETCEQTRRAADAGADGVLVVTPTYYDHDDTTLSAYYRQVADASTLHVYLYCVPRFTGVRLAPELVADLAMHPNVAGLKDSSGDLDALSRVCEATADSFETFTGNAAVYAHALEAGADGGIVALANVLPERVDGIHERCAAGEEAAARRENREVAALNRAITTEHGIQGLKAAMRSRGLPAGRAGSPHQPVTEAVAEEIGETLAAALP